MNRKSPALHSAVTRGCESLRMLETKTVVATPAAPPAPGRWARAGKVRPMILLWALGVPIPLVLLIVLLRSCV